MRALYTDDMVTLYCGRMEEVLPELGLQADCIVTDPPYGETKFTWDQWPDGWPTVAANHSNAMWCFGSLRMFFEHLDEFRTIGWKLSQDVVAHDEDGHPIHSDVNIVWEKHNGTGFAVDRFKRVHEHALHWYRGPWGDVHQNTPRVAYTGPSKHIRARTSRTTHTGEIGAHVYRDDGTRLMRSVIKAKSVRGQRRHAGPTPPKKGTDSSTRTQKPLNILIPLIHYACPPGGLVLDPFAGSGSTLEAARQVGRRAIGIEADPRCAEDAAHRLSAMTFNVGKAT